MNRSVIISSHVILIDVSRWLWTKEIVEYEDGCCHWNIKYSHWKNNFPKENVEFSGLCRVSGNNWLIISEYDTCPHNDVQILFVRIVGGYEVIVTLL